MSKGPFFSLFSSSFFLFSFCSFHTVSFFSFSFISFHRVPPRTYHQSPANGRITIACTEDPHTAQTRRQRPCISLSTFLLHRMDAPPPRPQSSQRIRAGLARPGLVRAAVRLPAPRCRLSISPAQTSLEPPSLGDLASLARSRHGSPPCSTVAWPLTFPAPPSSER